MKFYYLIRADVEPDQEDLLGPFISVDDCFRAVKEIHGDNMRQYRFTDCDITWGGDDESPYAEYQIRALDHSHFMFTPKVTASLVAGLLAILDIQSFIDRKGIKKEYLKDRYQLLTTEEIENLITNLQA